MPAFKIAFAGDSLRIPCNGFGNPPVEYFWQKLSGNNNASYQFSRDTGDLIISKPTAQHSGVYECRVWNTIRGQQTMDNDRIQLTIVGKMM